MLRMRVASLCAFFLLLPLCYAVLAQTRAEPLAPIGVRLTDDARTISAKLAVLGHAERRTTRDGGAKESWALVGTRFSYVTMRSDAQGRVAWITAFVRPGEEIPFSELGDLSQAENPSENRAAWNLPAAKGPGFRLLVSGRGYKARSLTLLSREIKPED